MPKYETLLDLSEAFKSGELDDSYYLVLDKGGNEMHLCQEGPDGDEEEREDHCRTLWEYSDGNPIQDLLELAGIPSEWC